MKYQMQNNIIFAQKFNNKMRYIDDLGILNNNKFDTAIGDSSHNYYCIDNGKYSTAISDQSDSFTFNIVNVFHLGSNIPSKPAYAVYTCTCISQLVCIRRSLVQYIDNIR